MGRSIKEHKSHLDTIALDSENSILKPVPLKLYISTFSSCSLLSC